MKKNKRQSAPKKRTARKSAPPPAPGPIWWERRDSSIHGSGLFAATDIPRGTQVIEYRGAKITAAEGTRRALAWQKKAAGTGRGAVYIMQLNKRWDIDGNVGWNSARLINHSCRPNCDPYAIRGRIWITSRRNIRAGEELSFDYGYDMSEWEKHPCRCGAPKCATYIVSAKHRSQLRRILARRAKVSP